MRKRLAMVVMSLTAAAVLLPAGPAAATTCVVLEDPVEGAVCVVYGTPGVGQACAKLRVC
ncbi:MAG TPA: hypothetical protein VEU29_06595 [Actinomycetota bacterium]|nr:hypothetical protein [Actinomycetota bacterium]